MSFTRWLELGYLQTAMNQYSCGGCWAFSAVSVLADRINIQHQGRFDRWLSPQHLLSCNENAQEHGCHGAMGITQAASHLERYGTYLYSTYPYDREQGQQLNTTCYNERVQFECCKNDQWCVNQKHLQHACKVIALKNCTHVVTRECMDRTCRNGGCIPAHSSKFFISAYNLIDTHTEIQEQLRTHGSLVAKMLVMEDFKNKSHQIANGWVYEYDGVSGIIGGHAVAVVGWGHVHERLYWIVRNSWGPDWGMNGFFYIFANQSRVLSRSMLAVSVAHSLIDDLPPKSFDQIQAGDIVRTLKEPFTLSV